MAQLDGPSGALFERLKQWRRLRAEADAVPAYTICHDATLAAIAEARPTDGDALLAIDGIGNAKLQRFGVQILDEVRAHLAGDPSTAAVPPFLAREPDALYERLRAWRRRRAVARGLKLAGETLALLAEVRPESVAEMAEIDGLDAEFVRRYGGEITAEVRAYGESEARGQQPAVTQATA
jgi:ATP-dependent DNA helicase RecQ